jgi:hypothetical protein
VFPIFSFSELINHCTIHYDIDKGSKYVPDEERALSALVLCKDIKHVF